MSLAAVRAQQEKLAKALADEKNVRAETQQLRTHALWTERASETQQIPRAAKSESSGPEDDHTIRERAWRPVAMYDKSLLESAVTTDRSLRHLLRLN